MKLIKKTFFTLLAITLLISCKKEATQKKGRFDFDKVKSELNLTTAQAKKFDATIAKYTQIRKENFEAAKEGGKMNRSLMMAKMQSSLKLQNEEITAFLTPEQLPIYNTFAEKMARFGKPGYSEKEILNIKTELALDTTQVKMLNAVNKAFEKSYSDAHDFYHGNSELAKEYWNRYDVERKNALKQVFTEEQHIKYLEIAKELAFKGEHGGK